MNYAAAFACALLVVTSAQACPIKKGYILNGLIKDSKQIYPVCNDIYKQFKKGATGAKWTELYFIANDTSSAKKISTLVEQIKSKGYKQAEYNKQGNEALYVFANAKTKQTMSLIVKPTNKVFLLGVVGK